MRYIELARLYERLEGTAKKLEKRDILAEFYKRCDDLEKVVLMSTGVVSTTEELGIARGMIKKVVMKAYGVEEKEMTKKFKETGDLGSTAEFFAGHKRQKSLLSKELTIEKVFENLNELPNVTGQGSQERKQQLVVELLAAAQPIEARYIIRTVLGDMRIGVAAGIVRDAIALAFGKEP